MMRHLIAACMMLLLAACGGGGGGGGDSSAPATSPLPVSSPLALVNAYRQTKGLSALGLAPEVVPFAKEQAETAQATKKLVHDIPRLRRIADAAGVDRIAENLARRDGGCGRDVWREIVDLWIASKAHREVLEASWATRMAAVMVGPCESAYAALLMVDG